MEILLDSVCIIGSCDVRPALSQTKVCPWVGGAVSSAKVINCQCEEMFVNAE
jgi:hypothetical protein